MTVRGDLWAVCMDCTPICDTFPSKGRRVSSQVLLMLPRRFVLSSGLDCVSVRISFGLWSSRGVTSLSLDLYFSWVIGGNVLGLMSSRIVLPQVPCVPGLQSLVYLASPLLDTR